MNPAPSPYHQLLSFRLQSRLHQALLGPAGGLVFAAPLDVELAPGEIVRPDLVVVLHENPIVTETRIEGVPDLVVEIRSPASGALDRDRACERCERAGVPEFWLVDPESAVVLVLALEDGVYVEHARSTGRLVAARLARVDIDLDEIW